MSTAIRLATVLLLSAMATFCSFAQGIKGAIADDSGKPVSNSNITLKDSKNLIIAYTISDAKGSYLLKVPADAVKSNLTIDVTCVGFAKQSKRITDLTIPVNFVLTQAVNQLKTVTVKDNHPRLRTSGDTLSYKVSDFSSPQDRVIGDVIKKLPGISVADDGKISYNGKSISNLYIGGDNLLDDKYNVATNTIPHGVVEDVQVIENHQPIKMLKNKVVSDDVALNLTIKKDAKLQLVGQETIGAGLPGNYDVELNAMMFKDKYKAINYLKGNNTGYDVSNDLVAHSMSDNLGRIDNDKPTTLLSLGAVSNPNLARCRYLFDQSGILNLNNLVNLKKSIQLKINFNYLHDTQTRDFTSNTQIYIPGDTVRYSETEHNRSRPDILHGQFTLNINKDKYYLNDALVTDYSHKTLYSNLNTNNIPVNQVLKDNTMDFSNEFNLMQTFKTNKIIEVYSYINHISEPENRDITPGLNPSLFHNNVPYSDLVQTANLPSWFTNNYVSYKIPGDFVTQSYKAGFLLQSQQLQSSLSVIPSANSSKLVSDSSVNNVNWTREKVYAEAAYDMPGKILKIGLSLPVSLQQIDYNDSRFALNKSLSRLYFNPQLRIKYQSGIENYFNLNYNYRNSIGTIQDIFPGYMLRDYRTLYANKADLTENSIQTAALGFNYRKAITLFFFSINTSYLHLDANNIASSIVTNTIQQRIVLPFQNAIDSWSANGSISKYVFPLRTTFSGGILWQSNNSNQIQNGILLPYKTISTVYNVNADTKISNQITFSYKATFNQTSSHSSAQPIPSTVKQFVHQASVDYNPMLNMFFRLSGEQYFTYQQQGNNLKYFFADASAKYRINKIKTDVELSAVNFLNVKNYSSLYLSANTLINNSYALPGRIVMLKVMFNI